jgi:hypothetical protein
VIEVAGALDSEKSSAFSTLRYPVDAWNNRLEKSHQGPVLETLGGVRVPVPTVRLNEWETMAGTVAPFGESLTDAFAVMCSPFRETDADAETLPGAMVSPELLIHPASLGDTVQPI